MRKTAKTILCGIFSALSMHVFAQSKYTVEELLCGYLENDLELQKLALSVEKAQLGLESTKIDQGFDITLSTGTMRFYANGDKSVFSVKPSVTASIPSAKNLSVSASTDFQIDPSKADKRANLQDTKIALSVDLLSQTEANQKIALLKSERALLESQRQLQSAALSAEKSFYTEFENILKGLNSILTYMQDVYTDRLSLEKLKAQGYSKNSSSYRIAEMKVLTAEHDIETAIRSLNHDFLIFYQHCGIAVDIVSAKDALELIPSGIPDTDVIIFSAFPKEKYTEIEKANWTNEINTMSRKADKFFTLGVNAGYTFGNSTTKSDTVDAGISTVIGGIGLNTGVSLPLVQDDFVPAFTLSATISPNAFRKRAITEKEYDLTEQQELIDIKTAEKNYETALIDYEESLVNLDWEKTTVLESYDLYKKNEADLEKYYKQGIVTESEYLTAKNNRMLYEVKIDLNKIDYLLYNNSVRSQFYDLTEEELTTARNISGGLSND